MRQKLRLRFLAWVRFFQGEIKLAEAFWLTIPYRLFSPKRIRRGSADLFGRSFAFPEKSYWEYVAMLCETVIANQYHVELIPHNAIVVDAGANMGMFSIFAARKHPDATIYAFEPVPRVFEYLKENTKEYPNIKIFNCALGESKGKATIVVTPESIGGNYVSVTGGMPIDVTTIDNLGVRVDFIKIDTEGFEANILNGAVRTIKTSKPIVAMSAYHHAEDKVELPKLLKSFDPGYVCELRKDCEEDLICSVRRA